MSRNVIEVRDLTAGRGGADAVRGASFTVPRGTVYALLGRYGSGKTTLLETVAGDRRPLAGTVRVAGIDPYARGGAGGVWREGGLFPGLTVAEVVETWRRWTLDPLGADEVLDRVGLSGLSGTPFERLGPGARRRLDLALALMGRSDVLFLDEPTTGLTGGDARQVRTTVRELAHGGTTVLLATCDPQEARGADRVGVLDAGRLITGDDSVRLRAA
ncbi:ATP-binding cassette domain-containing protein [Thermomonospora umbrina]|uniref:ABC-2 type transport system ATP-binding protein n=1 Tax=Thermomonospora umbrina TaxID=111806 RepID=A0A3D9SNB8_9ACTN|nr:ABC transporter ATP-binding protein [Thermomonospora umbrina]REE95453.1 ABC-2 type transport system ATP-binding protein [Thermomonospora umbrina]